MNRYDTTQLKAILIDMDGTLANSMDILFCCYEEMLKKQGLQAKREEFEELIGPSFKEIANILNQRYSLSQGDSKLPEKYERYLEELYIKKVPLFPGARRFLQYAKEKGWRLAVVTSASSKMVQGFIQAHDLGAFFDAVITPDGLSRSKPHPDIYQRALSALSISPDQAVVIEDSLNGVKAGLAAEIPTFHIIHDNKQPIAGAIPAKGWREMLFLLAPYRFVDISDDFQIRVVPRSETAYSQAIEKEVETVWLQQKQVMGDTLFNGKILSAVSLENNELVGEFRDYREYIAQLYAPWLSEALQLKSIGVSGVIFSEGAVLLGKRNSNLAVFRGLWELVPSGSVDLSSEKSGMIDILSQTKTELSEEAGLPEEAIRSIRPFALAIAATEDAYEVCVRIDIDPSYRERVHSSNQEYDEFVWVPSHQIEEFLATHREEIVPLSWDLLRLNLR